MSAATATLPARAGVGFKPAHFSDIIAAPQPLGFFEVHAENYMGAGGPPHAQFGALRARYALSIHGVGLSIGSAGPLDRHHLARLKALCDRYQPQSFSEHLAWSSHLGIYFNDLLPLPYTEQTLRQVVEHIDEVQTHLRRPMLLENPSSYFQFAESTIPETEFLAAISRQTGCGLLLDVNNVFVSAKNHGTSPLEYLDAFPLDRVMEIHLGGHHEEIDDAGGDAVDRRPRHAGSRSSLGALPPRHRAHRSDGDIDRMGQRRSRLADVARGSRRRGANTLRRRARERGVRQIMTSGFQAKFAEALLDTVRPPPVDIVSRQMDGRARRFAVHRNNVVSGLMKTLKSRFPVTEKLVGEEFFAAMTHAYVLGRPPRNPLLATYGDDFADFIAAFEPARELAYLADVARLEAARTRAYHAADATPVEAARFATLDAQTVGDVAVELLALSRDRSLVSSDRHHLGHEYRRAGPCTDRGLERGEDALVVRPHLDVEVRLLPPGGAAFLLALADGRPIGEAAAAGLADHAEFDLARNLAGLIGANLVRHIVIDTDKSHPR